jgi:hypothetical protein
VSLTMSVADSSSYRRTDVCATAHLFPELIVRAARARARRGA